MIRQPDFLTSSLFQDFVQKAKVKAIKKKDASVQWFDRIELNNSSGGFFAQIMHLGSYDSESETFSRLQSLLAAQGYIRSSTIHYEIYLGDPRKGNTEKLKTILRVPVNKIENTEIPK